MRIVCTWYSNCRDRLQPLDISVNKPERTSCVNSFNNKVCRHFQGVDPKEPVDLRLTILKPLGAEWMIALHNYLKNNPAIIQNGFNFIIKYLKQST